ncbi:MAG: hypothetical protein M3O85_00250 [Acidobacteriota bacterium]|nr:hypothetical protein [Acidobacteriota bacterium]
MAHRAMQNSVARRQNLELPAAPPESSVLVVSALWVAVGLILASASVGVALGQAGDEAPCRPAAAPLPVEQVVENLAQRNAQRAQALQHYVSRRRYQLEYSGFPADRRAEIVVEARYAAPATKEFTIVSQSGSALLINKVFKKLLEGEQEALEPENQSRTALNDSNYEFCLLEYQHAGDLGVYVLSLKPKLKNKFLYSGKIWVDGTDFAVMRIEAEPAKNPSFWIKKSLIQHAYTRVGDFWLPSENHTTGLVRLGGRAVLTILYTDYTVVSARGTTQLQSSLTGGHSKP